VCVINLDPCELWRETHRKARVDHACDCCEGTIERGEIYVDHFSKFDGYITAERMCVECMLVAEEFREEHSTRGNPGSMPELLESCVDEESHDTYDEERDEYQMSETGKKWQRYLDQMCERRDARKKRQTDPVVLPDGDSETRKATDSGASTAS
jgi:hypothetical protein